MAVYKGSLKWNDFTIKPDEVQLKHGIFSEESKKLWIYTHLRLNKEIISMYPTSDAIN